MTQDAGAPGTLNPVNLPARSIAPPATISVAAQNALSQAAANPGMADATGRPDAADLAGWRALVASVNAQATPAAERVIAGARSRVETVEIGGVTCHIATPPDLPEEVADRVYLFAHGGALVFGAGAYARAEAATNADRLGLTTISVDYRMPPDHPFPQAPEDFVAVYQTLLRDRGPYDIIIGGVSAGGNVAAAATLMIRDRALPLPRAIVLRSPEVDLTEAGDTFRTNALLDVTLKASLASCNLLYAAGADVDHPLVSPLYADFRPGFPPTFLQSGTRDMFLSNTVRLHRKLLDARVEAELHVWEAMPHAAFAFGFGDAPENHEVDAAVRRFLTRQAWPASSPT
ncbi:alpha/beta hydrolase [Sphingomonas sp. BK580]|uniref:alpha/beta hydrolase n=1 Tax=Sphingomonas sp. BK580 TaxID=2586972 RepID=UPI0016122858|nr:alpha/beta hydrolase [Sphingomonas sp. BK580]MBB3695624.1 acetyl esterase/lipase [Sphingomonas sp. BK580]